MPRLASTSPAVTHSPYFLPPLLLPTLNLLLLSLAPSHPLAFVSQFWYDGFTFLYVDTRPAQTKVSARPSEIPRPGLSR